MLAGTRSLSAQVELITPGWSTTALPGRTDERTAVGQP
jgi:hypothetical protein